MEQIDEMAILDDIIANEMEQPTEEIAEDGETEQVENKEEEAIEQQATNGEPEIIEETPTVEKQNPQTELLQQLVANQTALQDAIAKQQEQLSLVNQPAPQPEPELSEEELAMRELEERMGIKALKDENAELKAQLQEVLDFKKQQQAQIEAQRQQQEFMESINQEIKRFEQDFPDADQDKIADFIDKQPPELRASLTNYNGWAMVNSMLQQQAQPQAQPDKIISSKPNTTAPKQDTSKMTSQDKDVYHTEQLLRSIGL